MHVIHPLGKIVVGQLHLHDGATTDYCPVNSLLRLDQSSQIYSIFHTNLPNVIIPSK